MGVSRVHRLLRLITLLQSGRPRHADELTEELGISRRTLFRDLNMLEEAGVPYYYEAGVGYRISRTFFLPPISLDVRETMGLMLLGKLAGSQRDRPMVTPGLSAIYKLLSTVPEPIRSACGEMMAHVSVRSGPREQGEPAAFYATLQQCLDEGRACRVSYESPVEPEPLEMVVHPYLLHFSDRAWYVLGWTDLHEEVRVLKLGRIRDLAPLDRRFARPRQYRVEDKLGKAWRLIPEGREYDVELEFSAMVGQNVAEVRWHASQEQQMLPDGRCRMRFRVDGLREIAWWICGYADQVAVIGPAALRERVREMHQRAAARHGG